MATAYDVKAEPLIRSIASDLEEEIEEPEWTEYAKTGAHKERAPEQENWFYIRTAAILRKIYFDGPLGVSRLRTIYGGRKNKGHQPEGHVEASGKVIRTALQKLEEQGYLETEEGEGRVITDKGKSYVDQKANSIVE